MPIDERGYLNASRYFCKKKQIIALQDSYAEAMEVFGLERGRSKEETGANHQSLAEWHKQEEAQLLADIAKIEREKEIIAHIKETVLKDEQRPYTPQREHIGDDVFNDLK